METPIQISQVNRELKYGNIAILIIQFAIVGFLFKLNWDSRNEGPTGDGFPRNFGTFITWNLIYILALFSGTVVSLFTRHWKLLLVQWFFPTMCVGWIMIPTYNPVLDASDYQHFIGRTRADVETELKRVPRPVSGIKRDHDGEYYFQHYNGMTIRYERKADISWTWKVLSVTPD